MLKDLSQTPSIATHYLAELRNLEIQTDPIRFRRNLERLGEIIGYEISKELTYTKGKTKTSLGLADTSTLDKQPVLATILRAGVPLHQGLLNIFDRAESAFISAYRKHRDPKNFDIALQYVACPDLTNRVLILADPMLATGRSMVRTINELNAYGKPAKVHIVAAIACRVGVNEVQAKLPDATIWAGAVDEKLDEHSYIVPGLGDAGDLAFGEKLQN